MLIESISGVRGIVPSDLDGDKAISYALAFHYLQSEGSVVLGRDTRPSSLELSSAITERLLSEGRHILDCGICTTPTLQFAVEDTNAAGGIMVTASHNPEEWNGLKFVAKDGCFLNIQQFSELLSLVNKEKSSSLVSPGRYNGFEQVMRRHVDRVLAVDFIDVDAIRNQQYKVAIDTVNGAASLILPFLLEKLGCEVIPVHCNLQGKFPRGAEPLPENLDDLGKAVREHNCHLGLATDPDGDRLAVVDDTGQPLGEEYTLVLAVNDYLAKGEKPPIVVTNLSTTLAVDKVVSKYGGTVVRTVVGEINVVEAMKRLGARLGGEGNGGVILKDVHLGRDSLVGTALILNYLSRSDQQLRELFASLPQFTILKEKVSIAKLNSDELLERIGREFGDAEQDTTDGLKIVWPDRWVHIRKSNTEPILRIYAEARSINEAKELITAIKSKL
ncbi:MAG: phosphoglucosamine mutase [Fidelibacterota bacterium]